MKIEKILLTGLAIVGIIFILYLVYYFVTRWLETRHEAAVQMEWPPSSIMEMSAAQCPDYWINENGVDGQKHTCVNKFNLPVNKSTSSRCANVDCTNPDGKGKTFSTLKEWPVKSREDIAGRCLWRDCCGPQENIPASWVGISGTCGY